MFLLFLFVCSLCTDYIYLNSSTIPVRGYTSESIEISNPFSREFLLDVPGEEDKALFTFQPNQMKLHSQYSIYMGGKAKTLLESLRTPSTEDYRQILVFEDTVMVLKEMNEVEIVSYDDRGFSKKTSFTIKDINNPTVFYKAYKFKGKAILFANSQSFLLSNEGSYDTLLFAGGSESVAYAQWIEGTDNVLLAQYGLGLGVYRVDENSKRI